MVPSIIVLCFSTRAGILLYSGEADPLCKLSCNMASLSSHLLMRPASKRCYLRFGSSTATPVAGPNLQTVPFSKAYCLICS